jgi:hypothetical protein
MTVPPDDWRRMGQEAFLPPGTSWVRKPYDAHSDSWDHDHCEFCGAKFIDSRRSGQRRREIADDPEILGEGFATTDQHPRGAGYYWVCPACFADFAGEFGWRLDVLESTD